MINSSKFLSSSGHENSLLSECLFKLQLTLPRNEGFLLTHLNKINENIIPKNMHQDLLVYNRKLIFNEFQKICNMVMDLQQRFKNESTFEVFRMTFLPTLLQKLCNEIPHWTTETTPIMENLSKWKNILNQSNEIEFMRDVLKNLAVTHCNYYYGLQSNKELLTEKYGVEIEERINTLMRPMADNYFEQLLLGQVNPQYKMVETNRKSLNEIEAENTATQMRNMIAKKNMKESLGEVNNDKNLIRSTHSVINYVPYNASLKENNQSTEPQSLIERLLLHIENEQLNTNKNELGSDISFYLDVENLEINNFSEMSYYELNMMLHMADMIFGNGKFEMEFMRFEPYFQTLLEQLKEEIDVVKSEESTFRIVYQSRMKERYPNGLYPMHNSKRSLPIESFVLPNKNKQENTNVKINESEEKEEKKHKKGFFNKIANVIRAIDKPKHEKEEAKLRSKEEEDVQKYNEKYQNILIPESNEILQIFYEPTLKDMESFYKYISKFQKHEHTHQNITNRIIHFAEGIHKKVVEGDNDGDQYYHEVQSWMVVVMLLYRGMSLNVENNCEYTPFRRKEIIKICKRIFIQEKKKNKKEKKKDHNSVSFRNWPIILKFLENNRPEILSAPLSSTIEKEFDERINKIYDHIKKRSMKGSTIENMFENLEVDIENLPKINLVCLSKNFSKENSPHHSNKTAVQCKVVHILISGFLSEDTDKSEEWSDMVSEMSDSEVYALRWESNTISNLVKFFFKSAADVIGAAKMMVEIHKKYTDNPFNPAFKVAQITGRILAETVINLFPNRFINVCGYSLGSEVIKEFLRRINDRHQSHILNNVYIMGGVSDSELCSEIVAQLSTPITFYNCYTMNDAVLKHLLSLCKPEVKPMGLNEMKKVEGHKIINLNCTKFVSGHLAFRSNLGVMGEILDISIG